MANRFRERLFAAVSPWDLAANRPAFDVAEIEHRIVLNSRCSFRVR